jgi:Icc-related predicted phosphoesterase
MKIALVSDLHLEFAPVKLPATNADVLLLAGDIVPIAYLSERRTDAEARSIQRRMDYFVGETLSQYKRVFHIMGNHEYYHGVWEHVIQDFREYWDGHSPHITVLNNEAVSLDGVVLWGGTLWTDFAGGNPIHMEDARDGMNDYNLVYRDAPSEPYLRRNSLKLRPSDTQEEHENARYTLKEAVETDPNDKWVVMTHHLPSWRSIPENHAGSPLNWGYASDLDPFIETHPQIKVWVHGHTHNNWDYMIEETRILCNPRGYAHPNRPNKPENQEFNPAFVFEV